MQHMANTEVRDSSLKFVKSSESALLITVYCLLMVGALRRATLDLGAVRELV